MTSVISEKKKKSDEQKSSSKQLLFNFKARVFVVTCLAAPISCKINRETFLLIKSVFAAGMK